MKPSLTPTAADLVEKVVAAQAEVETLCSDAEAARARRDDLVRRLFDEGLTRPQVARSTGLKPTHVRWIQERH